MLIPANTAIKYAFRTTEHFALLSIKSKLCILTKLSYKIVQINKKQVFSLTNDVFLIYNVIVVWQLYFKKEICYEIRN